MVYHNSRTSVSVALLVALSLTLLSAVIPVCVVGQTEREVSIPASGLDPLGGSGVWCRLGQRLHINGTVSKIGHRVVRFGNPSGNIIFSIYDAETDEVLFSKIWGDAGSLGTSDDAAVYQHVVVSPALKLNQDVRLCVEYYGGNATDGCQAGYYSGDKITGQSYTNYMCYGQWHDIGEAEEGSYYLSYVPVPVPSTNGDSNSNSNSSPPWRLIVLITGVAVATGVAGRISYLEVKRRRHK